MNQIYKNIFDYLYDIDNSLLNIESDLIAYLPKTKSELYIVPGVGKKILELKSDEIVKAINQVIQKYHLLFLNKKNSQECYKILKNKIEHLNLNDIYDSDSLCTKLNESLNGITAFCYTRKIIIHFLLKKEIICKADEEIYNFKIKLTPKGEKLGFNLKPHDKGNGAYYTVIWNDNISSVINDYLFDIFYDYYGFNAINLINPYDSCYVDVNCAKEYIGKEHFEKSKVLIFDLDGTVFDTDFLRNKRRTLGARNMPLDELKNVLFIDGFEDIFLNSKSSYYIPNNKCYFLTNSPQQYAERLINNSSLGNFATDFELFSSCGQKKVEIITKIVDDFLESDSYSEIIGFGDDEKDAFIYEKCQINYYIVNNYFGYHIPREFESNIISASAENFRNYFLSDLLTINKHSLNIASQYFDDIIVYYRRYYGNGRQPDLGDIKPLEGLNYYNFGFNKSEQMHKNYLQFLDNDFKNFSCPKDVIFAKVPGHDELFESSKSSMAYFLYKLSNITGNEFINCLLLRRCTVEQNHGMSGANRSIDKHLSSIFVHPKCKIKGKTIYLFDDIVSSGASMMACVQKLYEAGAGHVVCFCLARTTPGDGYTLRNVEGDSR